MSQPQATTQNLGHAAVRHYPLNAWYASAWDHEVGRNLLAKTVAGRPIVFYRTTAGRAVALADACWHRLAPLSMGKLRGDDEIMCGYHGICYDADGRATFMPAQDTINPSATVHSYPVVERHRYVWVWPGDPALADPATVPDLFWNDHPQWAGDGKTIHVNCSYQLIVDNLMDLTHETFVHATSIGHRAIAETTAATTHDERTVTVTRWMLDIDAPPFWRTQLGRPGNVDRWQIIRFEAPCTIVLDVGVAVAGTGARSGDRSQGVNGRVLNTITPETRSTCMYFWTLLRNYRLRDQSLTNQLRDANARIFEEDRAVVEAQQLALEAAPHDVIHNLNIDSGSVWARRIIERMVADERSPASAAS